MADRRYRRAGCSRKGSDGSLGQMESRPGLSLLILRLVGLNLLSVHRTLREFWWGGPEDTIVLFITTGESDVKASHLPYPKLRRSATEAKS